MAGRVSAFRWLRRILAPWRDTLSGVPINSPWSRDRRRGVHTSSMAELAFHVAERHPMALQLVDAHFAGRHVTGFGYLWEFGHPVTPHALEAEPDLALYSTVELVFEALEGDGWLPRRRTRTRRASRPSWRGIPRLMR